jgi:hypothetical protein
VPAAAPLNVIDGLDLSHRSGIGSCHPARCSAAHSSSSINLPNVASTLMERGRFGKHGTVRYRSAGATHHPPFPERRKALS